MALTLNGETARLVQPNLSRITLVQQEHRFQSFLSDVRVAEILQFNLTNKEMKNMGYEHKLHKLTKWLLDYESIN